MWEEPFCDHSRNVTTAFFEAANLVQKAGAVLRETISPELANTASSAISQFTGGYFSPPKAPYNTYGGPALYGKGHTYEYNHFVHGDTDYYGVKQGKPYYNNPIHNWWYGGGSRTVKPYPPHYYREHPGVRQYYAVQRARYRSKSYRQPKKYYSRGYRRYSSYLSDKSRRSRYPYAK